MAEAKKREDYSGLGETKEEFLAEVARRHRHFRETGLHVTHEEALEWLRRRAKGENMPIPKEHN